MSIRDTVNTMYAAVRDGNLEALVPHFHDDFQLHEPPYLPYGGTYTGAEGLIGVLPEIAQVFDFARLTLRSLVIEDNDAVAFVDIPRVGHDETHELIEHWTFRDGRAASVRIYVWDPRSVISTPPTAH